MKKTKQTLLILMSVFAILGCSSDTISDLIDDNNIGTVSYNQNIKPIIDNYCVNCHGANNPSANLRLDTYESTREGVLSRNVIERISLPQGNSLLMPQSGNRLSQNNINLFINWQNEGFQP
jgi:hypothetical protein